MLGCFHTVPMSARLAGEQLDEGGLARAVGLEARDARRQRELIEAPAMIWRSVLG